MKKFIFAFCTFQFLLPFAYAGDYDGAYITHSPSNSNTSYQIYRYPISSQPEVNTQSHQIQGQPTYLIRLRRTRV
jgi:hypothetical protein